MMNLLSMICEELGIELEEEWESNDGYKYKISELGEIWTWDKLHDEWIKSSFDLRDVIIGELRPVWKPRIGETYYTPYINALSHSEVYTPETWGKDIWYDEVMQARGLIFRTKQEAINCANEMIELAKNGI